VTTQLDNLCNNNMKLPDHVKLIELIEELQKLKPLETFNTKYAVEKQNYYLLSVYSETMFRYLLALHKVYKSEELIKEVPIRGGAWEGIEDMKNLLVAYKKLCEELVQMRTTLIGQLLGSIPKFNTIKEKKRGWLAIERMLDEIDLKKSESPDKKLEDTPFIIFSRPGDTISVLQSLKEKETNDEIVQICDNLITKVQDKLK